MDGAAQALGIGLALLVAPVLLVRWAIGALRALSSPHGGSDADAN